MRTRSAMDDFRLALAGAWMGAAVALAAGQPHTGQYVSAAVGAVWATIWGSMDG